MTPQDARPVRHSIPRRLMPLVTALLITLTGCGGDGPTGPGGSTGGGDFGEVIATGGDFENPVSETSVVSEASEPEPGPDGTFWVCTETTYDVQDAPSEYASFNPNENIIFPGNLLQGATLQSDSPDPIVVKRAGGAISINLLNGSGGVRQTVDEVSRSKIREAANAIIAENSGVIPARFTVDTYKIQSREEMAAKLGVNVSTFTSSFNARMSFEQETQYNRVVVVLNQTFYQMDYDDPTSDAEVFAPQVTPGDLTPFIGPGNPAAYISSVAYGRRFYILVESTESATEIEAAVRASYNAAAAGGSISGDARYVSELSEVRVKVHAQGGDQSLAIDTFNGDFGAVRRFLTDGADYRTGVPLVYTLRALKDKKSIAVKVATRYTVRNCVPVEDSIENPIVWFDASYGLDIKLGTTASQAKFVRSWKSKFPSGILGTPTNADLCGFYGDTWINDDEGAIYFEKSTSSAGTESGQLKYDGRGFENSDYTVFVVWRPTPNGGTHHFAWGASRTANEYLALGIDGDTDEIFMSHGAGQTLKAPVSSINEWAVYTFRFSRSEGMSIHENDRLIGSDPSLISPVSIYPEAQIGTSDESFDPQSLPILLSQFKAYGSAVNEGQRRAQVINWINRFNL